MLSLRSISNLQQASAALRRWRRGRIVVESGRFHEVQLRVGLGSVSIAEVWWYARFGRPRKDICWLDFHQPWGMPGFLTVDYVRSGSGTSLKSFLGACHVLDQIAEIRQTQAIVAHVSNASISDRLLQRLGWEEHLEHWSGRHWIKRFYHGYPNHSVSRYFTCSAESPLS